MQQVVQYARQGKLQVETFPEPLVRPGQLLIQNTHSVISAGTEKSVIDLAQKSLLQKARSRPDLVRQVLRKMTTQGVLSTLRQVKQKLDEPLALGYASSGVVLAVGAGIQCFRPGDRIASNGHHAGVVSVPKHLCALVPEGVSSEEAAFAVIGSIALQGVRLAKLGLGDVVLVIGLGLLGQIAVKLLQAQGCRVIATDIDPAKCELAKLMGAEQATAHLSARKVQEWTRGVGADAVLITAATSSHGPVELAAEAVRAKGRVVVVGAVGLNLPRQPFYLKEAELVVSCSYGPGRYDVEYEQHGHDYPVGHVRWTEQRNMQAVLDLMAQSRLDVKPLITHRFRIDKAEQAYEMIRSGSQPYLGIVLQYPDAATQTPRLPVELKSVKRHSHLLHVGCIGAGGFGKMILLPAIKNVAAFHLHTLCAANGLSAGNSAHRFGFEAFTTDASAVLNDPQLDVVFLLTRHHLHASQVMQALRANKHVFVEKPLATSLEDLLSLENTLMKLQGEGGLLTVGFNRRFSPAATAVKTFFAEVTVPLTVSIRFNAGILPPDHWTQNEEVGGGRIVGEACHAIDLATYLIGSPPVRVYTESIGGPNAPPMTDDQCFITLRHANGSISNIAYLAGGDSSYPKERVEVLGGGRIGVIDDFQETVLSVGGKRTVKRFKQDKGHQAEISAFALAIQSGGPAPIPWKDLRAVTLASLFAVRSLREGKPFDLEAFEPIPTIAPQPSSESPSA